MCNIYNWKHLRLHLHFYNILTIMVHTYIQKKNIIKVYEISSTLEYIIEIISTKMYKNRR